MTAATQPDRAPARVPQRRRYDRTFLDGVSRCRACGALVLYGDAFRHNRFHESVDDAVRGREEREETP